MVLKSMEGYYMKITKRWLEKKYACSEAVQYLKDEKLIGENSVDLVKRSIKLGEHLDWAGWMIVRTMKKEQYLAYAIYAAEQVLHIFEKKYPGDRRPREAIRATKRYLKEPTSKNKEAAYAASTAAYAAYAAADAAGYAAYAAAGYAAYAYAADAAAGAAAYAAAYAADAAAGAAAYAAAYAAAGAAARKEMQIKILKYSLRLLRK
jgi:hypothetical protein